MEFDPADDFLTSGAYNRKDTGQLLAGASPGSHPRSLDLVLFGCDSRTPGTSRPVFLGQEQMASLGVAGSSMGTSGLLLGGCSVPCTVGNSKASSPRCVPVSPIDIPEMLVSQAAAGLTSGSNSQG